MKILLFFLISITLIFGTYLMLDYYGLLSREEFTAKVIELRGSDILLLSNNRRVLLAGVRIPEDNEVNYDKELTDNFRNYIEGKTLKFRVILKKIEDYPLYDTVLAYLPDGELVNDIILMEGIAFFDHGWYPNKNRFEQIEKETKKKRKGLWRNIDKYKIIYVSSKILQDFHLPDCPEIKDVTPKDRIDYYFQPPTIFFYRGPGDCVSKKWQAEGKVTSGLIK